MTPVCFGRLGLCPAVALLAVACSTSTSPSSPSPDDPEPAEHVDVQTVGGSPCVTPGTRDPALWPFTDTSPWNTPVGSDAVYEPSTDPEFDPSIGGWISTTEWSHPIYIAEAGDPFKKVKYAWDGSLCKRLKVPDDAAPDPMADAHLHLIDPNHRFVVETWRAERQGTGNIFAEACVVNDLEGPGVYDDWHGTRAYGGSAIGGLIREGELLNGIPHAVAVCLQRPGLNRNAPGGSPFVWPASSADDGWDLPVNQGGYGETGNIYMGSLLAIPPDVDVGALGLSLQGENLGHALQDYGAYLVDACGPNMDFSAEPSVLDELPGTLWEDIVALESELQVVTNNAEAAVGGGGDPRVCLAPLFQ